MRSTNHLVFVMAFAFGVLIAASGTALAVEKVGTTSMQVLKLPYGVRGIAMGNAGTASSTDAEAVWWNPAALTDLRAPNLIVSQINMPADIQLNSLVYAQQINDISSFSLHAINLSTDDMPVRTYERPEGTGENFSAFDFVAGGSYARMLTDKFSLGGNLRFLYSGLEDETYSGFGVDLGTLYKTSLRSLRLAMAIQNLGPDVSYSGTYLDYRNVRRNGELLENEFDGARLPTTFRLGVDFDFFEMFGIPAPETETARMSIEMNHPNDNKERLNLGGEYGIRDLVFLRAGGKFGYDEESFSAGFGLKIPVSSYKLKFDYAYSHWGRLSEAADGFSDQAHRMQLGFDLGTRNSADATK